MICPNCGQPVPDQSRFCENCGYPLQEESCEDNRTQPQPPKAHSNSTIIAIIVAAAAVLIVLIVCMTFLQKMLMYGKEASNRKQEIDRQHYTIPNQRPKDKHCGKI